MSFDQLAPHYDWLEALTAGPRLQRARTAWMDALADRTDVLSVGEGHGRFAAACSERFPGAQLTCLEPSAGMRARARQRLPKSAVNLRWIESDLETWQPRQTYDAVVTCFFLDCFTAGQLAEAVLKLAGCARPDAVWLVVDFAVPERGASRWRALALHRLMYAFFRIATALPARRLTPPDDLIRAAGFELEGRKEFEWGLIRADLWRRGPSHSVSGNRV